MAAFILTEYLYPPLPPEASKEMEPIVDPSHLSCLVVNTSTLNSETLKQELSKNNIKLCNS